MVAREDYDVGPAQLGTGAALNEANLQGYLLQPAEGAEPSQELTRELQDFLAGRLAKYKLPRTIDYVAELPRDPNGKLYKRRLRDPYWAGRERAI